MIRAEKVSAWLRLAAVAVAGVAIWASTPAGQLGWPIIALWIGALLYGGISLRWQPYRHIPFTAWHLASGAADWGLITAGILATSGARSDLYLLYFLMMLSAALRFGFREVLAVGVGISGAYGVLVIATAASVGMGLEEAGPRLIYLLLFAVGSGVLAREVRWQLAARLQEETKRRTMQEVTATVGHDLKNPLTAVTGLVEILLDSTAGTLPSHQRALLQRIDVNAQQMIELVNNLLDAELIERGQQQFRPCEIDINGLIRRTVEAQAQQAEAKQIGLVLDLAPGLPAGHFDGRMIERLVANLLSNAIKFTPNDGAIRVSTRLHGSSVTLEVWDSGPDAPAALQSTLFEKFVRQADSPGIGLGLYICRSIVDIHGGTLRMHKPREGGIAFDAELPLGNLEAAAHYLPERRLPAAPMDDAWQAAARAGILVNS